LRVNCNILWIYYNYHQNHCREKELWVDQTISPRSIEELLHKLGEKDEELVHAGKFGESYKLNQALLLKQRMCHIFKSLRPFNFANFKLRLLNVQGPVKETMSFVQCNQLSLYFLFFEVLTAVW